LKKAEIGIIGGSGLYAMPGLTNVREERVTTPFGDPSEALILGELEGRNVAFLARHGRGHLVGVGGGIAQRGTQAD
jgi:5'-methylthioadenosine phosphorylase